MNKQALRKTYKKLRAELDPEEIDSLSMGIANQALQVPIWEYSFYHLYLPIANHHEVNTECILHILQGKDKNIVLSSSDFENHTMTHVLLMDNTVLKTNSFGIPEPVGGIPITEERLEVVFVPLLAYDLHGNRVGYGKGFYDKFLALCKPETIKVGLSFFEPEHNVDDVFPEDVKLDYCITPKKIYTY